jgi:uncharacterized protein (TIGR00251 family)
VAAPPEKGKANEALLKFLESHYQKSAEIVSGHTAALKMVRLE